MPHAECAPRALKLAPQRAANQGAAQARATHGRCNVHLELFLREWICVRRNSGITGIGPEGDAGSSRLLAGPMLNRA